VDTLEPSYIPGPNVKMLITEEKWSWGYSKCET
jgi:hypothetical protein